MPLKRIWSENLKADEFADFCIPNFMDSPGIFASVKSSEDCLYVNIYVPGSISSN